MKTICILTATRAEWGLLRPIAEQIKKTAGFNLIIAATGTHFCTAFGNTYKEIIADGFSIDERVDIQLYAESPAAVSKTMALATSGFADVFARREIDLLIALGDRYETLAVCIAAMNAKIPIAHLYGGDLTEGAVDDCIRHAISKLSYLHFTSCERYRQRVIQLGEDPSRVYTVGAVGIDNIAQMNLLSKEELAKELGLSLDGGYAVVTFHPETLAAADVTMQCQNLLDAFDAFPELKFIITKSNADEGGLIINAMLDAYAAAHENVFIASSLGNLKYLSALKNASIVVGNSSSGIMEAPYFKVPVVNLGQRQKGRIQPVGIINCEVFKSQIVAAMRKALSAEFAKAIAEGGEYPYGDGHAAEKIVRVISEWLDGGKIGVRKRFYDLPSVEVR